MTHLRLWRFEVPAETEQQFVAAYRIDGDWAKLFATAPGFLKTELWKQDDGAYSPPTIGDRRPTSTGSRPTSAMNIARLTRP